MPSVFNQWALQISRHLVYESNSNLQVSCVMIGIAVNKEKMYPKMFSVHDSKNRILIVVLTMANNSLRCSALDMAGVLDTRGSLQMRHASCEFTPREIY